MVLVRVIEVLVVFDWVVDGFGVSFFMAAMLVVR